MNKTINTRMQNLLDAMERIHGKIADELKQNQEDRVPADLEDCLKAAVSLANGIAKEEGEENCKNTLQELTAYAELTFNLKNQLNAGEKKDADKIQKLLDRHLLRVRNSFQNEIPIKREVVFLPYKAAMWDSLESVWKEYDADPNVRTVVMPIPYYDRNPDQSLGQLHYEIDQFPKNVPVVSVEDYDLETHHPEEIYVHNPYDDINMVTSVAPDFYSKNLKQWTDRLVYIPYFVLGELDPDIDANVERVVHLANTPVVMNAHQVIVESESIRQCYIRALVKCYGEQAKCLWETKIIADESPKFKRVSNFSKDDFIIPEEWKNIIYRPDGSPKTIVLYNTSIRAMLHSRAKMVKKIANSILTFKQHQDDIALLWRPHPLLKTTLNSMCPDLVEEYQQIVDQYKKEGWGIYDDSAEMDRAIAISDVYYGDPSSLVPLCQKAGMPILIESPDL